MLNLSNQIAVKCKYIKASNGLQLEQQIQGFFESAGVKKVLDRWIATNRWLPDLPLIQDLQKSAQVQKIVKIS